MNESAIWVSWETHRRSRSLAKALRVPIFEIVKDGNPVIRYVHSILETTKLFNDRKIRTIFFQNPSIVLSLLLVLTRPIHKKKLVMDAHNAALFPFEGRYKLFQLIAGTIIRKVDVVIVTNRLLSDIVVGLGGNPWIISDPLPKIEKSRNSNRFWHDKRDFILLICTWAKDEPYDQVIKAMQFLVDLNIDLRITGKAPDSIRDVLPGNIILEGFVSYDYYDILISNAKVVVDLTTRESCLVCGAYEAASVGRPCILSDDPVAREVFRGGYLFTNNNAKDIAKKIRESLKSISSFERQMADFKENYEKENLENVAKLKSFFGL